MANGEIHDGGDSRRANLKVPLTQFREHSPSAVASHQEETEAAPFPTAMAAASTGRHWRLALYKLNSDACPVSETLAQPSHGWNWPRADALEAQRLGSINPIRFDSASGHVFFAGYTVSNLQDWHRVVNSEARPLDEVENSTSQPQYQNQWQRARRRLRSRTIARGRNLPEDAARTPEEASSGADYFQGEEVTKDVCVCCSCRSSRTNAQPSLEQDLLFPSKRAADVLLPSSMQTPPARAMATPAWRESSMSPASNFRLALQKSTTAQFPETPACHNESTCLEYIENCSQGPRRQRAGQATRAERSQTFPGPANYGSYTKSSNLAEEPRREAGPGGQDSPFSGKQALLRRPGTTHKPCQQGDLASSQASASNGQTASPGNTQLRNAFRHPEPTRSEAEKRSWSHSKRWMSEETKERMAYSKMMLNLRHIGADKSPFIPQNIAELAAFKADVAEANQEELTRTVGRRLAEFRRRQGLTQQQTGHGQKDVKVGKLLGGKRFEDKLSPVLAAENCFNEDITDENCVIRNWPSLAQLKEEGDRRAGRHGRYFPLPRPGVRETKGLRKVKKQDKPDSDEDSDREMNRVEAEPGASTTGGQLSTPRQSEEHSEVRLEEMRADK